MERSATVDHAHPFLGMYRQVCRGILRLCGDIISEEVFVLWTSLQMSFLEELFVKFVRHTGASKTSRSEKIHDHSGARVRSLQDRTNSRAFGGPRKTNPYTLLTWKSAMQVSETKKMHETRKSGATPVGLGARNENCFTPKTCLCQRRASPAQRLVQFRRFHKFKTEDSFSVSLLLLGEDKWWR